MKKTITLFAMMFMAITALAYDNEIGVAMADTVVSNPNAKQSSLTKSVTVQQSAQQQTTQQQPVKQMNTGIYKGMRGTYVTFRGHTPYKQMPTYDGKEIIYWPRFGLQIGAGQAMSFFTYEGVLEYMQTMHPYYDRTGTTVTEYINTLQGSIRVGGMAPIQLGSKFMVIPNVKGVLGGNFSFYGGVTSQFMAGVIGGLDLGFKLGNKVVTLGFVYEYRWYIDRSTTWGIDMMGGQLGFVF